MSNLQQKEQATKALLNLVEEKENQYKKEGCLNQADVMSVLKAMGNCQKAMQPFR